MHALRERLHGKPVDISQLRAPLQRYVRPQRRGRSLWQAVRERQRRDEQRRRERQARRRPRGKCRGGRVNEASKHAGDQLPAGRRLRRPGRLQAARVAGRKRRAGPGSTLSTRRTGLPGDPREPDLRRAVQGVRWIPQRSPLSRRVTWPGTLRLQREGSTAVVSYLSGSDLGADRLRPNHNSTGDLTLGANSGNGRFAHQEVKIAWDNLRINSGTISCPNPRGKTTHPTGVDRLSSLGARGRIRSAGSAPGTPREARSICCGDDLRPASADRLAWRWSQ